MCCRTPKQKTLSNCLGAKGQLINARLEQVKSFVGTIVSEICVHCARYIDGAQLGLGFIQDDLSKPSCSRTDLQDPLTAKLVCVPLGRGKKPIATLSIAAPIAIDLGLLEAIPLKAEAFRIVVILNEAVDSATQGKCVPFLVDKTICASAERFRVGGIDELQFLGHGCLRFGLLVDMLFAKLTRHDGNVTHRRWLVADELNLTLPGKRPVSHD